MKNLYLLITITCLILVGCKQQHEMVLELEEATGFYDQGFPSDLMKRSDGTLDLSKFPRPYHPFTKDYLQAIAEINTGFSPLMPLYLKFSGNVSANALYLPEEPPYYTNITSPIQLIDVDPDSPDRGKRFPLRARLNGLEGLYRPQGLLQILPEGALLRENNQYALIVLESATVDPAQWRQADNLKLLLSPLPPSTHAFSDQLQSSQTPKSSTQSLHQAYGIYNALRQQLELDEISADSVLAATTWTTGEPTAHFRKLTKALDNLDPPALSQPFQLLSETDDYCILAAQWQVPVFQSGLLPFALPIMGGGVTLNDQGLLEPRRTRTTPVHITIPKTEMPEAGFPLLIYNHGTSGRSSQVFTRGYTTQDGIQTTQGNPAEIAALRGWAASGMGGHMGADHQDREPLLDAIFSLLPGFSLNYVEYNLLNPTAMRDNLFQSIAERILYRRLLNNTTWDTAHCPEATSSNGFFKLNPQQQVVMGQSLGSMTSVGQAALDNDGYKGLIPTGAGTYGLSLSIHYGGFEFGRIGDILIPLYFQLAPEIIADDPFHPVWALAEMALSPANTALHAQRWSRSNNATPAPHVLVIEGHLDPEVTLSVQKPLLRALETDFAGLELALPEDEQLLPSLQWSGLTQLQYPVSANHSSGRTVGVVRYPEDGIKSGHYVTFQYEAPKHQIGCFLESITKRDTPVIVEGYSIGSPCY